MAKTVNHNPAPRKTAQSGSAKKAVKENYGMQKEHEKKSPVLLVAVIGIAFIVACALLQKYWFKDGSKFEGADKQVSIVDAATTLRMTEVMSNNSSVLQDDTGA